MTLRVWVIGMVLGGAAEMAGAQELPSFSKLPYNEPELIVDLAVGLWAQPLPMDFDGDGDLDMVAATAGVPSNGVWFYENVSGARVPRNSETGVPANSVLDPVFKAGVRIGPAEHNITVSYIGHAIPIVMTPSTIHTQFRDRTDAAEAAVARRALPFSGLVPGTARAGVSGELAPVASQEQYAGLSRGSSLDVLGIEFDHGYERPRANQWKSADYDGDDVYDLVIGLGVWDDYGWDDAFNEQGEWTNGPLHGYVYVVRNAGTDAIPEMEPAVKVMAGDGPVDTYGAPSPNLADFDGDGDLDLICGSFLDTLTYFENVGSRTAPEYVRGRTVERDGAPIRMDLQMLQVVALDWDADGDTDLVVGQEDGRIALWEHTGRVEDGIPVFELPRFFRQQADYVRVGVLPTPAGVDWDGDGDDDIIAGDTAGYINFVENLGGDPRMFAPPVYLDAGGERIRIQAGTNGGIQGPCEAKWGYTAPAVGDWDMDGDADLVINSIWGEVLWYENVGGPASPELAAARPVEVAWDGPAPKPAWVWWTPKGNQLVTQWRTSPYIGDMNGDGVNDLTMLDHEGYLALFAREKRGGAIVTKPGARVFLDENGEPLRLNDGWAGKSGRRKLVFTDWDGDGKLDLMLNGKNIDFWRNVSDENGEWQFRNEGPVAEDKLAGHTTAPAIVDWDADGVPDLLVGAEDGCLYYLENPRG